MISIASHDTGRASVALAGWRIEAYDYPFNRERGLRLYFRAMIRIHQERGIPILPEWLEAAQTGRRRVFEPIE